MTRLTLLRFTFVLLVSQWLSTASPAQEAASESKEGSVWDLKVLSVAPSIYPANDLKEEGVSGIFYDGLPWHGKPTHVFAWIGRPDVPEGAKTPGIVLVHGGGGTAFASWARLWISRGYAVVAMDNCGGIPVQTKEKRWKRHEHSGPGGWGGFDQIQEAPEDQWAYHAVADIILAHSLLLSMPNVDAERTGITGISWGGYLTCLAASLDDRFKFAIPIYGCGFTEDNGFVIMLEKLAPEMRARWMKWWDPSQYLGKARMPFLWVNGTNDKWYWMNAYQKSYQLPQSDRTVCLRIRMPHGHGPAGENPEEIRIFADSIVNHGVPLPRVTSQGRDGRLAWGTFDSSVPVQKAELVFTRDLGVWPERKWESIPAEIKDNRISVTLPDGVTVYYLNLTDSRNCVVSTEHEELSGEWSHGSIPAK